MATEEGGLVIQSAPASPTAAATLRRSRRRAGLPPEGFQAPEASHINPTEEPEEPAGVEMQPAPARTSMPPTLGALEPGGSLTLGVEEEPAAFISTPGVELDPRGGQRAEAGSQPAVERGAMDAPPPGLGLVERLRAELRRRDEDVYVREAQIQELRQTIRAMQLQLDSIAAKGPAHPPHDHPLGHPEVRASGPLGSSSHYSRPADPVGAAAPPVRGRERGSASASRDPVLAAPSQVSMSVRERQGFPVSKAPAPKLLQFDGNEAEVELWISRCRSQILRMEGAESWNPRASVLMLSEQLVGRAGEWWMAEQRRHGDDPCAGYETLEAFFDGVRRMFLTEAGLLEARAKFDDLVQKGTAQQYAIDFDRLLARTRQDWSDAVLRDKFITGLKEHIRANVRTAVRTYRASRGVEPTMALVREFAIEEDHERRPRPTSGGSGGRVPAGGQGQQGLDRPTPKPKPFGGKGKWGGPPPRKGSGGNPKGNGKRKGNPGGGGEVSPRGNPDIVCYNCGQKGHIKRDCPKPAKPDREGGGGRPQPKN